MKAKTDVIYSGVRIEPLPDPDNADKSLSKCHKYVYLRQTRQFVLWKNFLQHVPQEEWHPTILNALTVISTLSLSGKFRFRGTWPEASIYCHALYLAQKCSLLVIQCGFYRNIKLGEGGLVGCIARLRHAI